MDPYQLPEALSKSGHDFIVWYCIETILNLITIVNGVVMIMAFIKTNCLHVYFRTVCINVFVLSMLRSVLRILIFILTLIKASYLPFHYSILALWVMDVSIDYAQTVVIIERLWSSIRVNFYESSKSPIVIFGFVLSPFVVSLILIASVFGFKVLPLPAFLWLIIVFNTALWIGFYGFWKYNSWINNKNHRSWKLNIRYQQKENLQISVTMKWFGCYCSLQCVFVLGCFIWNRFDVRSQSFEIEGSLFLVTDAVFNLAFTTSTAFYPLPFIMTIEPTKLNYFKILFRQSRLPNKVNPVTITVGCNHRDYHFQHLNRIWNDSTI